MRSLRSFHVLAVLAIALLVSVPFSGAFKQASADTFSAIGIQVDHPSYAGLSETVPIVMTANGGPAADVGGNYSLTSIDISAANTTGFDWSPKGQANELGLFRVNLTMPGEAGQTVKFTVNITSKSSDEKNSTYATTVFEIKIVDPIVIKAVVWNNGAIEAGHVTARFFADGTLIHTVEFNLSAGQSRTLTYNWTFASIRSGEHIVKVSIDDPNSIVEFNDGNNVWTQTIFVGNQGNPAGAVLAMILIIIVVLFVLTYLQKPAKRTKKF